MFARMSPAMDRMARMARSHDSHGSLARTHNFLPPFMYTVHNYLLTSQLKCTFLLDVRERITYRASNCIANIGRTNSLTQGNNSLNLGLARDQDMRLESATNL